MRKFLIIFIIHCSLLITNCLSQSITWQKIYFAPDNGWSRGRSVCEADNSNFYVTGATIANGGGTYVLKLNPYGDTIWTKIFPAGDAFTVVASGDGGCVFTGNGGAAFTVKLNSNGDIIWHKTYGGFLKHCYYMMKTPDGGYIACGRDAEGVNPSSGYLLKIDSLGNLQWQKTYPSYSKPFRSVEIAHDGGYVVGGTVVNYMADTGKAFIMKVNDTGDVLWEKTFKGFGIWKIIKSTSGYLIGGGHGLYTDSGIVSNVVFAKADINGDTIFTHIFKSNTDFESIDDMKMINSNRLVISSVKDSLNGEILTCKARVIDSSGNIIYQNTYPTPNYIIAYTVLPLNNGDILFAGEANFNTGTFGVFAMRTDSMLNAPKIIIGINQIGSEIPKQFKLYQNYPNPFNPQTNIKFQIPNSTNVKLVVYDLLGKEIVVLVNQTQSAGSYQTEWNAAGFASGIYFVTLLAGGVKLTKKLVLIK